MEQLYLFELPPDKRTCNVCQQTLDLNETNFHRDRAQPHGFAYACKGCCRRKKCEAYSRDPEKYIQRVRKRREDPIVQEKHKQWCNEYTRTHHEQRKAYRASDDYRQQANESQRKRWQANGDEYREKRREYYDRNKEHIQEYEKQRRKDNPHYSVNAGAKVRVGLDFDKRLSRKELHAIRERDTTCYICSKEIGSHRTHFDHVIPLVRGGAHDVSNLRSVHAVCNHRKHGKLLEEMSDFQRRGP